MNSLITAALEWRRWGISTIPVIYKSKKPEIVWTPYKDHLTTEQEIYTWFGSELHNLGVVAGQNHINPNLHLVIIDFDNAPEFAGWSVWATKKRGWTSYVARSTKRVYTARGVHIYVWLRNTELNRKLPGIDVQSVNKYVLAPPSIHPSGKPYINGNGSMIAVINTLSEILPAKLLLSNPPDIAKQIVENVIPTAPAYTDVWEEAAAPQVTTGLLAAIKNTFRVQDFFPDAHRSSADGRWMLAKCPFHDDHSPSFWLDTEQQLCGCHTCGGRPLDVIDLYSRLNGINNLEAIGELRERI